MTTSERIEAQSFCYDPDFPPDVAEGLPLASAAPTPKTLSRHSTQPLRRALRAAGAALTRRQRS